jgi:DNA/RNA-binding domain of Phe-tRNA-synthetase-like protein
MIEVFNEVRQQGLLGGVVIARGVSVAPAPEGLRRELAALIRQRSAEDFPPAELKAAVRGLLRRGGFKPSGRSKPASEDLAQAAKEKRFPLINNLVDINNFVSLLSGLPISLLDLDLAGEAACLRYGRPGEKYVFNEAGQEIDLQGLICLCRQRPEPSVPLGSPVKDSMAAKIKAATTSVIGVTYAPQSAVSEEQLTAQLSMFGILLGQYGGAGEIEQVVV